MTSAVVEVVAPSRLHFGMLSFGNSQERQFGGLGAMIDQPGLRLIVRPHSRFEAVGPLAERVASVAERAADEWHLPERMQCRIEVLEAPPLHAGLGTGTQLAVAVVAGLQAFRGGGPLGARELARVSARAARSAIGTYGFTAGGLLFDPGKVANEMVSPLEGRVDLPSHWRFVLVCLREAQGISGEDERLAFRELPPISPDTTARLRTMITRDLLPAAQAAEFDRFGHSLFEYGHTAGMCFAPRQGGPFASREVTEVVETIRSLGIAGVGQSSWGPTVFALVAGDQEAADLKDRLAERLGGACLAVDRQAKQLRRPRAAVRRNAMKQSAGTLLYRFGDEGIEVLLVHPSGNYNSKAPWSIPKGLPDEGESLEDAARRETFEEAGVEAGTLAPLGSINYQKSGKRVHAFAGIFAGGEPRCASWEIDAAQFVTIERARQLLHLDQQPFLDRLLALIHSTSAADDSKSQ